MLCRLGLAGEGQVNGRCRAQQDFRDAILRCALRARVAADADALFSSARPEPAVLLTQDSAVPIEQSEANGSVAGHLNEIGAILLDWRGAHRRCAALRVLSLKSDGNRSALQSPVARKARIESQQIGVVPGMESRWMAFGPGARSNQYRFDEVLRRVGEEGMHRRRTRIPQLDRIMFVQSSARAH